MLQLFLGDAFASMSAWQGQTLVTNSGTSDHAVGIAYLVLLNDGVLFLAVPLGGLVLPLHLLLLSLLLQGSPALCPLCNQRSQPGLLLHLLWLLPHLSSHSHPSGKGQGGQNLGKAGQDLPIKSIITYHSMLTTVREFTSRCRHGRSSVELHPVILALPS